MNMEENNMELNVYSGGYSEDGSLLDGGKEVWTWPESQALMDLDEFRGHAELINDEFGLAVYGSSAYAVDLEWLRAGRAAS